MNITTFATLATILASPFSTPQEVGKPAPAIVFEHSFQGPAASEITWEKLRGNVVVLEFWATWCSPCLAAIPHLNDVAEELADEPFRFISVTGESSALIEKFLDKRKMSSWVAIDSDGSVIDGYGVSGIPRTFVIDKQGNVVLDTRPESLTVDTLRKIAAGTFKPAAEPDPHAGATRGGDGLPRLTGWYPGVDPLWMPWIDAGEIDIEGNDGFFYQSVVRPAVPGGGGYGTRSWGGAVGITILNATAPEVIAMALQLPSPLRIVDAAQLGTDQRWDVIFSRPSGWTMSAAWEEVAAMMQEVTRTTTEPIQAEREVIVATVAGDGFVREADIDWEGDPTTKSLSSLSDLLVMLEEGADRIVVSGSEDQSQLYLDTFGCDYYSLSAEKLQAWLEGKGVTFVSEKRTVDLVKIVRN